MKADARKRRIFDDAVDLLCGAEDMAVPGSGIQMLPIDSISPFRNHPFRLYEGERLEDMVESIREHGILNPVIVWKNAEGYEMLAGHNRQNAGRLVGLTEVPAIVKYDLTEKEAYVYVIETNVMQRGFAELLISFITEDYDIGSLLFRHLMAFYDSKACAEGQLVHMLFIMCIQNQDGTLFQKVRDYLEKPFVDIINRIVRKPPNLKRHICNHFIKEIVMGKLEEIPINKVDDLPCRICIFPGLQYGLFLDIDSV